ncbi:universal stress protein [Paraburkholderia solitsugae]|uniref:universal stress protein n=1 Tax=Paraburkholderia solitsugae TaxID=2675748 RepID=UPI001F203AA4|nr:universal stress protein [Paraburkholderia solitsugae]
MAPFNRILLCYDATPEGRLALRFGAALAQQLQAETHLLSIFDYTYWSSGFDVLSSMKFEVDEQAAQETLREGIDWLRAWGVTATGHYSVGNAIDQISRLADSLKVDLIVIGHHPHGFLRAGGREKTTHCCSTACLAASCSRWPPDGLA